MRKLIGVAALLLAGQSQALQWVSIGDEKAVTGEAGKRDLLQVETSSIEMRDGYRQGLSMRSFFPVKQDPALKETDIGSIVSLEAFDCKKEEQAILNFAFFPLAYGEGKSTRVSDIRRANALEEMRPAAPGSFSQRLLKYVCAYPLK